MLEKNIHKIAILRDKNQIVYWFLHKPAVLPNTERERERERGGGEVR
jgi:hypothetical protein